MKKIAILLLILTACAMQAEESSPVRIHAGENKTISTNEFNLSLRTEPLVTGKNLEFTFEFSGNFELQPSHDAPMHFILVSKDLEQFYHLHPELNPPATLTAENTFEKPGQYRAWIEFNSAGTHYIVDYDLVIE